MKGENISGDDLLSVGLGFAFDLDTQLGMNPEVDRVRKDVLNTVTDDYTVDTCEGFDTGVWETGIQDYRYNFGAWVIVSQYRDRSAAVIGHQGWVDEMENGPPATLTDVFSGSEHAINADTDG